MKTSCIPTKNKNKSDKVQCAPANFTNQSARVQRAPTYDETKSVRVFFILGHNPELSRAEILAFMRARNRTFKEILFEENLLVLETQRAPANFTNQSARVNENERFDIQEFGGLMKLGKILFEGTETEFSTYLHKNEIIPANKFSYATFGNINPELLKEKFKSERKKAMLKHGRKRIKFQD